MSTERGIWAQKFLADIVKKQPDGRIELNPSGLQAITSALENYFDNSAELAKIEAKKEIKKKLLCIDNPHRAKQLKESSVFEGWDVKSFQDTFIGSGYHTIVVVEPAGKHWRDQEKVQDFIKQIHTRLFPGGFFIVI